MTPAATACCRSGIRPRRVLEALARPQVMANVMTPNLSQMKFGRALKREIGRTRGGCPYTRFLCLNSGSESVTLAARIADVNAKLMTDPGARYAGRTIKRVAVKGAFHGRTEKPAIYSDSSRKPYQQHLASFRDEHSLVTVEPYNVEQLRQVFADADKQRLVHRGDVHRARHGRRRSGPFDDAGVLRGRARADAQRTAACC